MLNRIRDIRKAKGLTLADLAAACVPPTTAQTIGRLETGTRQLSLVWMNRIAAALGVDPASLMRAETGPAGTAQIVAELAAGGASALTSPRAAVLPSELADTPDAPPPLVLMVSESVGEYRPGDLVWLRQLALEDTQSAINRDCLVPRPGGRFAFGRLIDRRGTLVGLLPPGAGQKQVVVDNPAWIAVAMMLVRPL
ncbi:MAG: helix-turn-helix transcriptional regulator [Erythrobacter sp.]|jgi:transcriptional regulator with XRE-family HTH domain|uniref:helix-turn-helix domain-containing protein n=1 Tax=Erythrobacter sp. TaxID=1042 RepID=UPI002B495CE0|nr:helix-turn-helix transcriptional regulator [Erythrobacter sp.]WRH71663.1 MAG: helix-turn-helix transcriptional regulator [Erythrobacter sp.]